MADTTTDVEITTTTMAEETAIVETGDEAVEVKHTVAVVETVVVAEEPVAPAVDHAKEEEEQNARDEEAARVAAEEAEATKEAERKAEEEAAHAAALQRAQEEEEQKAKEEEAARVAAEEAARQEAERVAQEEENARVAAAMKKAQEEEEQRVREEEAARAAAEESARREAEEKAQQEAALVAAAMQKAKEEEEAKAREEEEARAAAAEAARLEAERLAQEENARVAAAIQKAQEEEEQRIREEEAARAAAEEAVRQEKERLAQEENARVAAAIQKAQEEEEQRIREEEAARAAAEEAERQEKERLAQEENARVAAAIQKAREDEERKAKEEEEAKEEARRVAEEEARKAKEQEAAVVAAAMQKAKDEEDRKKAEEAARVAEAQKRAQEEADAEAAKNKADNERIAAMIAAAKSAEDVPTSTISLDELRDEIPKSTASLSRSSIATPPMSPEPGSHTPIRGRDVYRSSSIRSSAERLMSPSPIAAPVARTRADGPPIPISAVTGAVRANNPILDELLHSISLLQQDDPSLTVLDLKDCQVFTIAHGSALAGALARNTHLKELNLSGTKTQTITAVDIAEALKNNSSLEILNLENNQIAPQGIKALAECLESNSSLQELKLANQKAPAGTDAEQAFAKALQKNESLKKLGILFRDVASRNAVDRAITRNREIARKARFTFLRLAKVATTEKMMTARTMAMMAAGLAAAGLVTAMPQDPAFLPPTNPDASGSSSNDTGPSFVPFTPVFEQFYPSGQQPVFVPDTPQAPNPAFVGGSGGQTDAGTYASSGPSATSSGGLASTAIPPAGTGGAAGNKTGTGSPTSPTATPAPAPSMTYPGGLSQCQYMQILKMTSVFETGSTKFNWGACGNNNDGHGLSVGVVQFTTSTSVYDLVVEYDRLSGGSSKLTQYLGALKASKSKGPQGSSGQGVMDGLWSFCSDFGKLGSDPNFQQAQLNLQNKLYFQPAADAAAKHGITAPLFLGQAYDTAIQLGVGVVGQLAQNAGGKSGDQAAYMSAYLWARNDMLNNWGGAYPGTKYRTNAYRHCLDNGGLMLAGTVEILDNGGYKTISIGC